MKRLTFESIRKSFGGIQALGGVDGHVDAGEILGLVGPNGSGKSTLINVLSGHYRCDGGRILVDDTDITDEAAHRVIERGIARTYQIPRPFATMTTVENVSVPLMFGARRMGPSEAREEARRWLDFTGLTRYAAQPIGRLNLHQLKYLELARALAARPEILFLDEVLAGLNPAEIEESIGMIRRIHEDGVTLVVVEHVIRVVMALSTRIMVLDQGRLIAEGDPAAVMEDPEVISAYLGRERA